MRYRLKKTTQMNLKVGDIVTTEDMLMTIPTSGRYRFEVKDGVLVSYMRLMSFADESHKAVREFFERIRGWRVEA